MFLTTDSAMRDNQYKQLGPFGRIAGLNIPLDMEVPGVYSEEGHEGAPDLSYFVQEFRTSFPVKGCLQQYLLSLDNPAIASPALLIYFQTHSRGILSNKATLMDLPETEPRKHFQGSWNLSVPVVYSCRGSAYSYPCLSS